MIFTYKNIPIYLSTTLSEKAEKDLISNLLENDIFKSSWVQRRLASYPLAIEAEKDILILELMEHFWKLPASNILFSVFRDFDKVFTVLGKKGHFIHQFEVFLLGWHLINQLIEKDRNKIFLSKFGNYERLFYSWLFVSTAHDFGYPLQLADELSKKFSKLYNKIHLNSLSDKYKTLFDDTIIEDKNDLRTVHVFNADKKTNEIVNIDNFILDGIKVSIEGNRDDAEAIQEILKKDNHGYISAMIFCRTYIAFLSEAKRWNFSSERWRIDDLTLEAAAIALHAIPMRNRDYINMIFYNSNPLAYLLILIDNLQEWNRTLRPSNIWPSYSLIDFKTNYDSISLRYMLNHEKWTRKMQNDVRDSLAKKAKLINLPIKPNPSFNFKISVEFTSNSGHRFDPIFLKL
jgi:hypothetical protein